MYSHEMTLEGYTTYKELKGTTSHSVKFRVGIRDCAWQMELNSSLDLFKTRSFVGCDGTNIYTYVPGENAGAVSGFSDIWPGTTPQFGGIGPVVWLAFASKCVLKNGNNDTRPVYLPIPNSRDMPSTVIMDTNDLFPVEISYLGNDGLTKTLYTNASYRVLSMTNVDSLRVPVHFILSLYTKDSRNLPMADDPWATYEGIVTNILKSVGFRDPKPGLSGRTSFSDKRISDPNSIMSFGYVSDTWIPDSELPKLPEYRVFQSAKAIHAIEAKRTHPTSFRRPIVVLFLLSTLLIGILFVWRTKRQ